MQNQKLCLKWNNHMPNMLSLLGSFQQKDMLVDVTISCQGQNIKAHKIILSACSPYFQNIFMENPCQHPIIIINGMKFEDITAILNFMYKGEVNVCHDGLSSFLQAAEALKVKGLAEVCGEKKGTNSISQEVQQSELNRPQRTDTPPRKRPRNRKRSLSDSNRSDDEGLARKHREPSSPEVHELSGDESFTGDNSSNGPAFNTISRVPQNVYSRSHQSSSNMGPEDDDEYDVVESNKMLDATDSNVSMNNTNTDNNLRIERIMGNATEIESSSMADPESPPDIKPIINFGESSAGPSESGNMMLYNEQSQPGPSSVQDSSLLHDNSHAQGNTRAEDVEAYSVSTTLNSSMEEYNLSIKTEDSDKEIIIISRDNNKKDHDEWNSLQSSKLSNENWANEFEIPYGKFPFDVLKQCKEGFRLDSEEKNHVIRILAYEIAKITKKPGKKNLEIIAAKVVKQYSKTFQDVIGDKPFGNGYASFLQSLITRFDNMNRIKKNSLKAKLSEISTQCKKAKKRCLNFQPDCLPRGETESTQKDKQKWLQVQYSKKDQQEEKITKAMSLTFASQRLTINSMMFAHDIIKQWPYLSKTKYILQHFNLAMKPYSPDWTCIFRNKIPELITYLKSKVKMHLSECSSIAVLQLLCAYFKENNNIVQLYRDCNSVESINTDECPVTPFIAVLGTKSAVVFIQKKAFSSYGNLEDAFKVWFASFFVFNLEYPEDCQATMEFIQRGLMGIPTSSSNNKAKKRSLKLVKELCNFKNVWIIPE